MEVSDAQAPKAEAPETQAPQSLWRLSRFRNLWLAQTVSVLGTQVTVLAFPLVALLLKASALDIGLLSAVEFLPVLLFGLPAGAWVERLPRRRVMLVMDAVRTVAMVSVPIAYAAGVLTLPLLFVVAFIIGLGTLFFDIAQMSYLPALVADSQLAEGNAKLEGSRSFGQLSGPTVGGFLIQLFSAPIAVLVDALSYAASFVLLLFVRGRDNAAAPTDEGRGLGKEIAEGVRFVVRHPLLRPLAMCDATANFAFAAMLALQVFYAARVLHLGSAVIGTVLGVGNAGGLIGAVVCGALSRRLAPGVLLMGSIVVFTVGAVLLPLSHGAVVFGAGLFLVWVGVVIYNITTLTMRQLITPERLLSRMNATLRFIEWSTLPLGAALGGVLVAPLGVRGVLWGVAVICGLSILPPLLSPVSRLKSTPTAEAVADVSEGAA
ncbi:MAG TPA: MFS transporter [Actinocrinis sp.]|uniref:MFS transporter n=1 Tax=Actinocrinis sp. TaxID=1920516 RepID=UPI002DDCA27E|nr:MFS transporter [Actinocrinis sp.]HEV2345835.1 MFS transporter [Actinocrinis sp.]